MDHFARVALGAIADAGLLVEAGSETRTEWGTAVYRDGSELVGGPGLASSEVAADARVLAHEDARAVDPSWRGSARKLRRTVHTGPWRDAS